MAYRELSVATFNLYNLNLPGLAIYADRDGWAQDQYDRKIAWSAAKIALLGADIIGFQELWHPDALAAVFDKARLADEYDLLTPPNADGTRIVCAAAVRKGLLEGPAKWVTAFPDKFRLTSGGDDAQSPDIAVMLEGFSRPVLHCQLRPREDEPAVQLFVCHLKSKAPTQLFREGWYRDDLDAYKPHATNLGAAISTIRRTAEAAALRWLLTERMKKTDTPVIVLGDLNDGQHSNTLNVLTEQPSFLGPLSKGGADDGLYSAQAMQQLRSLTDVYYTHVHKGVRESLDHVLVSEQFYDQSKKRLWAFDELVIENDHLNDDDHKRSGTGDHGIVKVTFKHKPA